MSQLHYGPRWCWPQLPSVVEMQRVMAALYRAERRRIGEAEYQSWFNVGEWPGTGRQWLRDNQAGLSSSLGLIDNVQRFLIGAPSKIPGYAPPPEFSP